jgi:membrane-associated protease RseP (regulator of RpoE activity)
VNLNTGAVQDPSFNVTRPGALGVTLSRVGNPLEVTSIYAGSVAERAGLEVGDRIRSINGQDVTSTTQLRAALSAVANATGNVTVVVERAGRVVNLDADFAKNIAADATADVRGQVSANVGNISGDLRNIVENTQGTVRDRLSAIHSNLEAVRDQLGNTAGNVRDEVGANLSGVHDRLVGVRDSLRDVAQTVNGTLRENIEGVRDQVDGTIRNLEGSLRGTVGNAVGTVNDTAANARSTAAGIVGNTT